MSVLRAVSGSPRDLAERLAEESQGMIIAVMSRKFPWLLADNERAQDAYSFAYIYLWRAAKRFDPARGLRFSTLAYRYIEGGLRRFMEGERKADRVPTVALEELFGEAGAWEEHLDGSSQVSAGRSSVSQEEDRLQEDVRWQEMMHGLPARIAAVLTLRYRYEHTFQEIGDALGMTRQAALNLERLAAAVFRERTAKSSACLLPSGLLSSDMLCDPQRRRLTLKPRWRSWKPTSDQADGSARSRDTIQHLKKDGSRGIIPRLLITSLRTAPASRFAALQAAADQKAIEQASSACGACG